MLTENFETLENLFDSSQIRLFYFLTFPILMKLGEKYLYSKRSLLQFLFISQDEYINKTFYETTLFALACPSLPPFFHSDVMN